MDKNNLWSPSVPPAVKDCGKATADLSDQEKAVVEVQTAVPSAHVTYGTLFRYASNLDVLILVISTLAAVAGGAMLPLMTILFGSLTSTFRDHFSASNSTTDVKHEITRYSLYFVYLAIGEFATVFIATAGFSVVGEHLTLRIRERYLRAVLHQNIGYFDSIGPGEVSTRISADISLIQAGISEKLAIVLAGISAFVAALVISFVKSWKLSLIVLSSIVALIVSMGGFGKAMGRYKSRAVEAQALAGNIAEEAIGSIRTATAFGAQEELAERYNVLLKKASSWGFRMRAMAGFMIGISTAIIYLEHALSFWQGSRFLVWGDISLSAVITIQLAIMMGGAYLGQALPHIEAFSTAVAAAQKVFTTIDRESPLDAQSEFGEKLPQVEGRIDFEDVKHIYPSRHGLVLQDFSLSVPAGKVTAVVGPSGCGKSTLVSLIERFYVPIGGNIRLDGFDIMTLNLRWLRQQISLVNQDPILFSASIYQNIEYGLVGRELEHESKEFKESLVAEAAKIANAHDFIITLPRGYETQVGSTGFLLSGGQKQRIAIARAIISNPKLLILDEATSAMDSKSEAAVQLAIEQASKGRTTLVIAHRLSTVRRADNIAVMSMGRIVEQGRHDELMQRSRYYNQLVLAQKLNIGSLANNDGGDVDLELREARGGITTPSEYSSKGNTPGTKVMAFGEKGALVLARPQPARKFSLKEMINFMWALSKHEKATTLLGALFSILSGTNQPVRGILFAHSIAALSLPISDPKKIRKDSDFWAGMFFMLAVVVLIACSCQGLAFARSSERLIRRAQNLAFRSILRQDIAFFDRHENSPGALSSLLSNEASRLAGASGATLGAALVFLVTVFGSVGIALGFGWKLGLVCLSVMPLLIFTGFLRFWILAQYDKRAKRATDGAAFASEAIAAIRTVASLAIEPEILRRYSSLLVSDAFNSTPIILKSALAYAFSQSFMFLSVALGFWYGGNLVADGEYDILRFFICFTEILFGAQSAGNILSFAPEIGNGWSAAESFKRLIDLEPGIDSQSLVGEEVRDIDGSIEFRDVHFRYPERPEQEVLRGLSFEARPAELVAIVGSSGSGKSTAIALIERFYDPESGFITCDGKSISSLKLAGYRNHIALVSQETTIYSGTVRDNLTVGFGHVDVTEDALVEVCKSANIYEFIMSLPEGFETLVGPKGNSLSGGQKQRLGIARALLRNPRILLLDEATSALDSESEKAVELALQKASRGRTTIAIAHRLSSIQHADRIYVLDHGKVVESGTHEELVARNGRYCDMARLQSLAISE